MEKFKPPKDYQPYFEDLKWLFDRFTSYESLSSKYSRYLELKESNTLQSYIDEINFKLYQIEWDIWNHQRNEDYIKDIILRLNLVFDNCNGLIQAIEGEIERLFKTKEFDYSSLERYIEDLRIDPITFINGIKENNLRSRTEYLVITRSAKTMLKEYLEKFEAFINSEIQPKSQPDLKWLKSDTDLLELVTALYESKSINNESKDLTRKDAILLFSQIFNLDIKDVESKLVRATERKKDTSPFLGMLKKEFDDYSQKKVKE